MKPTPENPTNENELQAKEFNTCGRKRPFSEKYLADLYADYFSDLYDKLFGVYRCRVCESFHLFSLKLETAPD